MLRGRQPGKFTIAINQRDGNGNPFRNIFFSDGLEALYFTRYVLEHASDYESAVKLALETKLLSRAYYTIGGISDNQGCVIERSEDKVHS